MSSPLVFSVREKDAEFTSSLLKNLRYDREGGDLYWSWRDDVPNWWNKKFAHTRAGYKHPGRRETVLFYKGRHVRAHRVCWLLEHGEWPPSLLDHVNGDRFDNRIANLRLASVSENNCNRGMQSNNKAGFKGVYYNKPRRKWAAIIGFDNKKKHLGLFMTPEEAHFAYVQAAKKLHGKFVNGGKAPKPL